MESGQKLKNFLQKKKSAILEKWFQEVLETYPAKARNFLKNKENTFANPIGSTIYESLKGLLEEVIQGRDLGKINKLLDPIIRLRAVQDLSPSQALSFLPAFKKIVKEELNGVGLASFDQKEIAGLEAMIDYLTLHSFDIYMGCREKIFNLKIKESQRII